MESNSHMRFVRASGLSVVPAMFIVVFFLLPVLNVGLEQLRLRSVVDVISDGSLLAVLWFSLWQSAISTVVTFALGLPAAWVLSRFSFPGRSLVRGAMTAPFVMPAVIIAAGVLAILPDSHNRGIGPIVWAHVIFNVAVVIRVVSPRWSMTDERLEHSASMLGANGLRTFRLITWPQVSGAVINSAALVFIYCFTSFGVVAVLGGFGRRTIETEIFTQSVRLGDVRTATALACVQAIFVGVVLVAARRRPDAHAPVGDARAPVALREHPGRRWVVAAIPIVVMSVVVAPLAAVVVRSVWLRGGFTLAGWRALSSRPLPGMADSAPDVIATSAMFAVATAIICVPLALVIATFSGRITTTLSSLPLVISAATLGTGIIVTFDHDPFAWRSQAWLIPVIHAVIALPLVVRLITPARMAIPDRLRDAAVMLGATPFQVWSRIDLRILRPALSRAVGLAMAVSLGEFGATSFISRSGSTTLPIVIARLLGRPGDVPPTAGFALASLMIIATIGVMSRA